MGLQFENLVLNNRKLIYKELNLAPDHILQDNPFFQRKTTAQQGCQIDYLIQTKFNTLYICEIKFNRGSIGLEIIDEVKQKISRMALPRGYSCIPVLICTGDVSINVLDQEYFAKVINAYDWFN